MRKWRLGISCNLGIVRQFSAKCRPIRPDPLARSAICSRLLSSAGDKICDGTYILTKRGRSQVLQNPRLGGNEVNLDSGVA